jgi:hypothetical protein
MTGTETAPPGWYADRTMVNTQRYWDGSSWTDLARPMVDTPDPRSSLLAPEPSPGSNPTFVRKESSRPALFGLGALLMGVGMAGLLLVALVFFLRIRATVDGPEAGIDEVLAEEVLEDEVSADEALVAEPVADEAVFGTSGQADTDPLQITETPSADPLEFDRRYEIEGIGHDRQQRWRVIVGQPIDVTASVLDDDPTLTLDPDQAYLAIDIEMAPVGAAGPMGPGFGVVVVGGATNIEYWEGEPPSPACGETTESFSKRLATADDGQWVTGRICMPVLADDAAHPETAVDLITDDGWARFGR